MSEQPYRPVCSVCEKELEHPLMCNLDNTSGEWLPPDAEPEHGQFGLQYIGRTCARRQNIPAAWLVEGVVE